VLNPFREINWQPGLKERRKFAVSLMLGLPCVALVGFAASRWRGTELNWQVPAAVGLAGAVLGVVLWLLPRVALPFYLGWYAVAGAIGFVTGNLILAGVYLLVFAPLGLILRGVGRRAVTKTFDRKAPTYWRDATPSGNVERYYRQY
jgi:hypothetical protein